MSDEEGTGVELITSDPVNGVESEDETLGVRNCWGDYRLVSQEERPAVEAVVERLLADHAEELKVTPGKMVYELQPRLDWDKGKAVLYLLDALDLDRDDVVPCYVGDDITDEHAFEALSGTGIGVFVGRADDPEVGGRTTAADFVLDSTEEVERFLDTLAR